jgi:hypothetical protein
MLRTLLPLLSAILVAGPAFATAPPSLAPQSYTSSAGASESGGYHHHHHHRHHRRHPH